MKKRKEEKGRERERERERDKRSTYLTVLRESEAESQLVQWNAKNQLQIKCLTAI